MERDTIHFVDTASAAEAAAESLKKAIAAAEAAAYLAKRDTNQVSEASGFGNTPTNGFNIKHENSTLSSNSEEMSGNSEIPAHMYKSQSFGRSRYSNNENSLSSSEMNFGKVNRRYSYNESAKCDIKFDESDCDEEIDMEEDPTDDKQPNRPPPQIPIAHVEQDPVPRIHPKLPDYDTLTARFEALKYRKSHT
ncbi:hypothetical protein U1Q18_011497 [Sarracenia purpurea var. burkii]